jgi:hypothetical protein
MKKGERDGFIKTLTVIVVGACIMFIIVAMAAKYIDPSNFKNAGTSSGGFGPDYTQRTNPLLGFLDSAGGAGSYDSGNIPADAGPRSASAGKVALGSGSGSYTSQPFEEYVTIENRGAAAIDITGWKLQNGKGLRPVQNATNDYFYPTPDTVTIGYGTEFLDPSGKYAIGDIVLQPGDSAIVTTGGPFAQFPLPITTSFRENACMGYLKNYPFEPSMSRACPAVASADLRALTQECSDYVTSLSSCADPEREDKSRYDEQTSICKNFIATRYNYPACVLRNRNQPGFSGKEWRIFLGQKKELWASERETITLLDRQGNVVDRMSY